MSRELDAFIAEFVVPLVAGGDVLVGRPIRPRERDVWAASLSTARSTDLAFWRHRRAQLLVANPHVEDPDADELSLWIGLHNLLVFEHPDRARVWAREVTWRRLEGATRSMLTLGAPQTIPELLARHIAVGAFVELLRAEIVLDTPIGEVRVPALEGGRRLFRGAGAPREQSVPWFPQSHAPEAERLLEDALRTSPMTCLLHPTLAPPGFSPLSAAPLLREPGWARAVCHAWASHRDWMVQGGAVLQALLPSVPSAPGAVVAGPPGQPAALPAARQQLALPGAVIPTDPADVAAVTGALVHLHLLKVLELDTRVGFALGGREPGVLAFVALPLLLPHLGSELGEPVGPLGNDATMAPVARRWTEYCDHLAELVPRSVIENLLATLVARIVQPP